MFTYIFIIIYLFSINIILKKPILKLTFKHKNCLLKYKHYHTSIEAY